MRQQIGNSWYEGRRAIFVTLFVYLIAIIILGFLPRGSDQYWSLANVERVIHGDGLFKTNNIFPAGMPSDLEDLPRPWVQNRPVVYFVTAIAWVVKNAQLSWILCNAAFLFITAWMMLRVFRTSGTSLKLQSFGFVLLLLFPLNFYLVMQALPEQFNQLLVMLLFMMLLLHKGQYAQTFLVAIVAGILMYQRDNFLLLIFFIPLYLLLFQNKDTRLSHAFLFIAIMGLMYLVKPLILESHTIKEIPILSVMTEVRPGNHNMVNYLYPQYHERSFTEVLSILIDKTLNSIARQFSVSNSSSFFLYTINLLLIPFIIMLSRYKRLDEMRKKGIMLTLIFTLVHFITIFVFENQYRFSAVLIPLLIVCFVWWIQDLKHSRFVNPLLLFILFTCLITDAVIAYSNRKEALNDKQDIEAYTKIDETIIKDEPVMVHWTDGKSLLVSYGLQDSYCYYFPGDASMNSLLKVSEKLNTNYFIVKQGSGIYKQLKPISIREELVQKRKKIVLLEISR